jgi:hypothetical protein
MSGWYNNDHYGSTPGVGLATNASFTGPWFRIDDASSIGIQVVLTATSSPVATWGLDVTDDEQAPQKADADIQPGITAITLTSDMTAQNPNGTTTDRNFLFQFDPSPRAKWARWKYTRSSGGSASLLMKIGVNTWGARA